MKKFKFGGKKGITIISVVITVVLIILLAAVAISVLSAENNIIDTAKESKHTQDVARISEKLELLKGPIMLDKNKVDINTYMEALEEKESLDVTNVEWDRKSNYAYVEVEGEYSFLVEDRLDGNVIITYNGIRSNLTLSAYEGTIYHPNTITFKITENQSGGALSVESLDEDIAVATIEADTVTVESKKTGETNIIVKSEKTEEFGESRVKYTLTVKDGRLGVVATGYSGVYDGQPHKISVTSEVDANITFSTSENGTYTTTNPSYTNAGTNIVYYKVEKDGYETVTGSAKVEITKAEGKVTLSEKAGTITYPNSGIFTVTENLSEGTLRVGSSDEEIATVSIDKIDKVGKVTVKSEGKSGKAIITVTSETTTNYKEAQATYEITVENGTLDVTATGYTGAYDGKDHGIEVICTTAGATITYSDKENGTFTGTNPTYRNVGKYTTYYKVEKPGYNTVSGNKTIEITKAEGKITLSEISGQTVYGEEKVFTVTENLSQGNLSVKSSDENVAEVSITGRTVTIEPGLEVGKAIITVTSEETANYKEATATYQIDVKANENTLYKVIHQKMKLDETYETVETEEKTGEALTKVTPDVKTYEGFKAPAKQEVTIAVDGSTTITYKYERNKYAFTLGNIEEVNTTGSTESGSYYYEQEITLKATANEGYIWSKWLSNNTSLVSNKDAANTTFIMPAGPITMTPSVEENTYTIEFNANGGEGTMASISNVKYTESKTLTANTFTKTGYTFAGWNTKADGTGTSYSDKASVTGLTTTAGATVTLYAKWTENIYTIAFNANGGTGSMSSITNVKYSVATTLTANTFTRAGYIFAGWNTKADGTGTSYSDKASVTGLTTTAGATVTLYAKWTENTYTIEFNANGGTGSMASITNVKYSEATTLTANTFTKTGYTFAGWNTKQDGTGTSYSDKASVTGLTTTAGATVTLYAKWTANNYLATYDNLYKTLGTGSIDASTWTTSNGEYIMTASGSTSSSGNKGGYITNINTLMTDGLKYRIEIKAKASKNITLPMRFECGPVSKNISLTTEYQTFYIDFTFDANTDNKALVFYGSWVEGDKLYIKDIKVSKIVTYDSTYGELYTPTKDGYTFNGWYTQESDGSQVLATTKVTTTENQTLYARWTENSYNIAFNANGGTGTMSSITNVKYTATTTLTANTFTRAGYTFAGWNTKQDGTGTSYANSASVSKLTVTNGATVTLYAKWTESTYDIAFNANGGTGTMPSITNVKYTEAKTLTANTFTRDGYTFAGWNTKEDGTGTSYTDKASVSKLTVTNGATVTLYAKWNARTAVSTLKVGDYVKYTAPSKEYTVAASNSGTSEDQSFNTSSYTGLWRVLYNDSNGLQLISDSTVINLDINGKVGYNNLFTTLNTVSNNYVNSTYAVSGRSVGSSPSTTASTADTTSLYANSTYSFVAKYANDLKIADTKYTSDEAVLSANNMLNVANKDYWMASRYIYSSANGVGFHGLVVGTFNDYTGLASVLLECAHVDGEVHDHKHTAGVRPVVKLNTNVKVKAGSGTSSSPWELIV